MKLEDYGAMSKMDDAIASADEMLRDIELLEARMNARSENFQNFLLETAMTSASVDYEESIEKCQRARDQVELDMDKAWVQLMAAYDDAMDSELSESDTGESVMDEEDVPDIDEEGFKRPFPVARPGCPPRRKPHQLPKQIRPTSIGAFGDLMSDDSPTSSDDEDILDSPTSSPSPASPSSDTEDSTTGSSKEADITLSKVDNVSATIANTESIATTASETEIPASNTSATSSSNFNSASTQYSHQSPDPEPILEAVEEEEYVLDLSMPKQV